MKEPIDFHLTKLMQIVRPFVLHFVHKGQLKAVKLGPKLDLMENPIKDRESFWTNYSWYTSSNFMTRCFWCCLFFQRKSWLLVSSGRIAPWQNPPLELHIITHFPLWKAKQFLPNVKWWPENEFVALLCGSRGRTCLHTLLAKQLSLKGETLDFAPSESRLHVWTFSRL